MDVFNNCPEEKAEPKAEKPKPKPPLMVDE